ncbi:hypothetical protein KCP77_22495 [Salmonella enterica subsp. enterica]|nr:hypothetical protein KCP77_22495 [Salmonella enterica subsp. enterica]
MLESGSDGRRWHYALRSGLYDVQTDDIFIDSVPWRCEQAGPLRLQKVNHVALEFRSGRDATGKGWPDYLLMAVTVNAPEICLFIAIYRLARCLNTMVLTAAAIRFRPRMLT